LLDKGEAEKRRGKCNEKEQTVKSHGVSEVRKSSSKVSSGVVVVNVIYILGNYVWIKIFKFNLQSMNGAETAMLPNRLWKSAIGMVTTLAMRLGLE
jgi:hypothetical protein